MNAGLIVTVLLSAAVIGSAQQRDSVAAPARRPTAVHPLVQKAEKKPYSELFLTKTLQQFLAKESQPEPPKLLDPLGSTKTPPHVVCGLVILDRRRDIDPQFVVATPPGNYTIRRIEPPVCRN